MRSLVPQDAGPPLTHANHLPNVTAHTAFSRARWGNKGSCLGGWEEKTLKIGNYPNLGGGVGVRGEDAAT